MRAPLIVAMLVVVPAVAAAQSQRSREPVVQVGIYGYQADGTIGVSAFDTADTEPEFGTTVYLLSQPQRCGMGAGSRKPPADATDAWQFTGKVVSATREEAVVQLKWRRLIVQSRAGSGDESSAQFTLRAGESMQLDQAALGCNALAVAFEAKYTTRFSGRGGPASGIGGGGGGRAAAGSTSGPVTANAGKVARGGGLGTSGAAPRASGEGGGTGSTAGSGLFDVNLWLVRSVPGKPDDVTHSLVRMNQDGASFAFPPVPIATSGGTAMVQVTGSFAVTQAENGEQQLVFSTSRRVTNHRDATATVGQSRERFGDIQGTSRTTNRMPGPEEVLAFEMPPIRLNEHESAPDQFSVRVKIAPRR